MAASRHVSAEQLMMFMPAGGLQALPSGDIKEADEKTAKFKWKRKLERSKVPSWARDRISVHDAIVNDTPLEPRPDSLYLSIQQEGVKDPVHIGGGVLSQGHHRVAAQVDIDPDRLVPVEWHETQHQAVVEGGMARDTTPFTFGKLGRRAE